MELIYLALPSVEMSLARVAERVAHGGHSVPADDIARRFPRSLHNLLHVYGDAVDVVRCFMNSGETPQLVFIQEGGTRTVLLPDTLEQLTREANR